jgi:outer membrane protein
MTGLKQPSLLVGAAAGVLCMAVTGAGRAETLADAIAMAYRSNPTLQAERAQQRVTDETYVQARAGYRPTASVGISANYADTRTGFAYPSHIESNSGGATLTVTQPLYTGGRTEAAVEAAEATVAAGREGLRSTEAQILQAVVQAYTDVRRDQQILAIRDNNLAVLRGQLELTRAKFEVGQITRTDVAQAEAQLASARALLSSAQAQLQISRANYTAVVGQNPGELAAEPPIPGVPPTVDQAFDTAEAESPVLRRARSTEQASRARIAGARAANRPSVALQGTLGYTGRVAPFDPSDYNRAVTAEAVVTQPLFTGGLNSSNIRAALQQNNADRLNIEAARRQVVQTVSQAWNVMAGSKANVVSDEEQVRAARVAFEGTQEEYKVGLRTTLDVLIAQQTLRDAELALVQARHDAYVAEAGVLGAMGRLEARYLVSGVDVYDPIAAFDQVKNRGATPLDPLVAGLDAIGAPHTPAERPLPEPLPVTGPAVMRTPTGAEPSHPPLSTDQPTAPSGLR